MSSSSANPELDPAISKLFPSYPEVSEGEIFFAFGVVKGAIRRHGETDGMSPAMRHASLQIDVYKQRFVAGEASEVMRRFFADKLNFQVRNNIPEAAFKQLVEG